MRGDRKMRFKVGDRVKVRKLEDLVEEYGWSSPSSITVKGKKATDEMLGDMLKLCGETVTINEISHGKYGIEEMGYWWVDEMFEDEFEHVEDSVRETNMKFEIGDRVTVRSLSDLQKNHNQSDIGITIVTPDDMVLMNNRMLDFCGKTVTINKVEDGYYGLIEDDGTWCWIDEMFEDKHCEENEGDDVDLVNNPSHYTHGEYEVIDVIEDWELNYRLGNAVKYIARCEHKGNKIQDLEKAIWYLRREIDGCE